MRYSPARIGERSAKLRDKPRLAEARISRDKDQATARNARLKSSLSKIGKFGPAPNERPAEDWSNNHFAWPDLALVHQAPGVASRCCAAERFCSSSADILRNAGRRTRAHEHSMPARPGSRTRRSLGRPPVRCIGDSAPRRHRPRNDTRDCQVPFRSFPRSVLKRARCAGE